MRGKAPWSVVEGGCGAGFGGAFGGVISVVSVPGWWRDSVVGCQSPVQGPDAGVFE